MKQYAMLLGYGRRLFDRLNRTDLVIHQHYAYKYSFICDRIFKLFQIYSSLLVYVQVSNLAAFFFEKSARMKHRVMLYLSCYNMISL